ncbi:MAG: PilZ domain-containing protein [Candidatus Lindowbacteria bacterium]|nr:PilZ domain-containing protein [Candidatus Lindowbacteria bacterium]
MFEHDRRLQRERRNGSRPEVRRKQGTSRRNTERTSGIAVGWAIVALSQNENIKCWILNESKNGALLETQKSTKPCPILVGQTYWIKIKPSEAKRSSVVAGVVRRCLEKSIGTGIYKFGIQITTDPPAELGKAPKI